ncbi:MAG TPA: glycosyltransferase family 39 protein [Gaiellaceae bacterium]|jgi:hypothetical protein
MQEGLAIPSRVEMKAAWQKVEPFVSTRRAAVTCFVAALAVFGIESIAWPLAPGRDAATYLDYYVDMWHAKPAYPFLMLFRTPVAPLFYGVLLQVGGPVLAECGMALAYATSVLAFALAARRLGSATAVLTAIVLLALPGYGALFHQVSSDPIFALTVALFSLAVIDAIAAPSTRRWGLAGLVFAVMVLTRPGAEILIVVGLVALVLARPWRARLAATAAYVGVAAAILLSWSAYNDVRYGDFTIARGAWAGTPFYRTFVMEKIVRPDNGPASRKLAAAVSTDLLTKPPYAGHISVDQFFAIANDNMWSDLVYLSDRHFGWGSNYTVLRDAALEAIRRHPKLYLRDVASGMWSEVSTPYPRPAVHLQTASPGAARPSKAAPAPPAMFPGIHWWLSSTPNGRAADPARVARQLGEAKLLEANLPDRSGSPAVATVLNDISRVFQRMEVWIALGLLALLIRRPRGSLTLVVLLAGAVLVLLVTLAGYGPTPEYGLPFDPVFVLFGVGALTLPRRRGV